MKKLATLFLVLIFISQAFFASDEIMNSNEAVNEGFICGTPLIPSYIHGEYFFAPLGSDTGYYGGLEMELEGGVNFTYNLYRSKSFALKLGCDFGYYMQWLQYNSNISSKAHLSYNGMMLRPTFTIQFAEFSGMPLGIAIYYQKTAIIPYSDYDGLGVMLIL